MVVYRHRIQWKKEKIKNSKRREDLNETRLNSHSKRQLWLRIHNHKELFLYDVSPKYHQTLRSCEKSKK